METECGILLMVAVNALGLKNCVKSKKKQKQPANSIHIKQVACYGTIRLRNTAGLALHIST